MISAEAFSANLGVVNQLSQITKKLGEGLLEEADHLLYQLLEHLRMANSGCEDAEEYEVPIELLVSDSLLENNI